IIILILFFFFSSRRRHTRSKRDWSSDVCSSDLLKNFLFSCARSVFNKFFKWLFIFSLSRAALTSFLYSVSETTTFSVGLFSVFIFGLPNQFFSPVGTSTFFNCLLALASSSIGTFSLKANNSFFFSDKSCSSCFISRSKSFFSL